MKEGHDICHMEYEKNVQAWVIYDSGQGLLRYKLDLVDVQGLGGTRETLNQQGFILFVHGKGNENYDVFLHQSTSS